MALDQATGARTGRVIDGAALAPASSLGSHPGDRIHLSVGVYEIGSSPTSLLWVLTGPPNTAFSCEGPPLASTRGAAKRLHVWHRPWDLVSCNALFSGAFRSARSLALVDAGIPDGCSFFMGVHTTEERVPENSVVG